MFRRNKDVKKAKLQRKLYLARENPEPIFDLSECDLKEIPSGIYSLCRVFLKESLRLQSNCITSLFGGGNLKELQLLQILDISCNAFSSLPDEICLLSNLQEFYVNNNHLKKLPNTICLLTNLKILNISHNLLKQLPEEIGNLENLRKCFANNNKLTFLPKSIHKWRKINTLVIDVENLIYPPATISSEGLVSIMKYICEDIGEAYLYTSCTEDDDEVDKVTNRIMNVEQQKVKEFLEIEKYNEFLRRKEYELATTSQLKREQLLSELKNQQNQLDQELDRIQQDKKVESLRLIKQLQKAESDADVVITYLLTQSSKPPGQLLEQEKQEEERLLTAMNRYNETLRKDDILEAMENILKQETQKFKEFGQSRIKSSKSFVKQESEMDNKLLDILQSQDEQKSQLVNKLIEDNNLQKVAVGALLERGDARSWGLLQRIRLVETQLAALTKLELDKKRLEVDQHLNELCERRYNLSTILMNLLNQQKERRAQILVTLQTMEDNNNGATDDFWLKQYQQLLEKLPHGLSQAQKNVEPLLVQALIINRVIHCLPFLAKITQNQCDPESITDSNLMEAGVNNEFERKSILDSIRMYVDEKNMFKIGDTCATAPPLPMEMTATAPFPENIKAITTSECVICMDSGSEVIFVPCGHFCSCVKCSDSILECPLCRSVIESKINLIL